MSRSASVEVRSPEGQQIWIACGTCGKVTCHQVLTVVATSDESPDGDITAWDNFLCVQCGGCKTVSFCVESSCSEDMVFNPRTEQEEFAVSTRVYPSRIAGRSELEHSRLLPYGVYRIYEETRAALCNDLPVLAGIGIRAIVETVCKDRGANGRDLKQKIDALVPLGVITPDGAKIMHSLRFMGNEAAHEVKAHSQEELSTAFDVGEYLLKGVYILPKLAAKLPKKGP